MESCRIATLMVAIILLIPWASSEKIVCYYGSWATYRNGNGKCDIEDFNPKLCTHMIYSFVGLNPSTNEVKLLDSYNDLEENWGKGSFKRFNALRSINPNLKTLVAIGGWNEGSVSYSRMAASQDSRRTFILSVVQLLEKHGFDGFDVDWEYPANRGGTPQDKENFVFLLKEMREEFDKYGYLLSAAVGAGQNTVDTAYNVPAISKYLDFINVMTYDFHGSWESVTGHHSPLYHRSDESPEQRLLNVDYAIHYFISKGAPPEKLILGLGMYGQTFTLVSADNHGIYAPARGPGQAGPYTQQAGMLGYNEICEKLQTGGWTVETDLQYKTPYAYKGDQWVGFDDENSIRTKCNYAKALGLGGVMIWSIETEDFRGVCGKKYPLLSVINEVFAGSASATSESDYDSISARDLPVGRKSKPGDVQTSEKGDNEKVKGKGRKRKQQGGSKSSKKASAGRIRSQCATKSLIRDPDDCNKFYVCGEYKGHYITHQMVCPSSLFFDESINACNFPSNVKGC